MKLPATDRAMMPGPWFWSGNCLMANRSDHSELVADVAMPILSEADKALIAAAPAMRDALQKIVDMNVQYAIDRFGDASKAEALASVKTARAALSLAGGKP
jgi:hypothetical protein